MNYYIQGSKENAEKISAAFKEKGYKPEGWTLYGGLYYTCDESDKVQLATQPHIINIIKTHPDYNELELPVQPKFKVGDWVVFNNSHNSIYKISEIKDSYYTLTHTHGGSMPLSFSQGELLRPWSIEDAKDGDILHHSCTASNGTFIFKGVNESGKIFCYCDYDSEDHFCLGEYHHIPHSPESKFLHPATKEQRDLLFKKMKEAGYQWDADKKELKKIQPHYDISNFHAGMPVLVRETSLNAWQYVLFSHCYIGGDGLTRFNAGLVGFTQCIPFEGNERLLGTTDMCPEEYVNW